MANNFGKHFAAPCRSFRRRVFPGNNVHW